MYRKEVVWKFAVSQHSDIHISTMRKAPVFKNTPRPNCGPPICHPKCGPAELGSIHFHHRMEHDPLLWQQPTITLYGSLTPQHWPNNRWPLSLLYWLSWHLLLSAVSRAPISRSLSASASSFLLASSFLRSSSWVCRSSETRCRSRSWAWGDGRQNGRHPQLNT